MRKKNVGYLCEPTDFSKEHLYYPLGMGFIEDNRDFLIDRNSFPGYLVMCCTAGRLWVEQYGATTVLSAGQSCLMTLQDRHRYYSDPKESCTLVWLHFGGKAVQEFFSLLKSDCGTCVVVQDVRIPMLVQECMEMYRSKDAAGCFGISAAIYQMLLLFLKKTVADTGEKEKYALQKTMDAFLEEHIAEKITLEQMAEQWHLAPAYFCRRFRKETGLSPMAYLMEKRLEMAKFYLLYTNERIFAIAEKLGFYDQNHFAFCFGKAVGMSPTKYRERGMQNSRTIE